MVDLLAHPRWRMRAEQERFHRNAEKVSGNFMVASSNWNYDPLNQQEIDDYRLTMEERGGEVTTNTWDGDNRLVKVEHDDGTDTTTFDEAYVVLEIAYASTPLASDVGDVYEAATGRD